MKLATASFALAVTFLLGVHHVQAQTLELITQPDSNTIAYEISEPACSAVDAQIQCTLADCDTHTDRENYNYVWLRDQGMQIPDGGDTQFGINTNKTECTSILVVKQPGNNVATDLVCRVDPPPPAQSVSARSFIFPEIISIQSVHQAFGLPDQGLAPSSRTNVRVEESVNVPFPFLGETMMLTCQLVTMFSDEQFQEYINVFQPFACVSQDVEEDCLYHPRTDQATFNVTFDKFQDPLEHTCSVVVRLCGNDVERNTDIHIVDPAIIHPYSGSPDEDSVTASKLEKGVGEVVTICCNYTGIDQVTAEWTAVDPDGGVINLMLSPYTIDDSMQHGTDERTEDPGHSCISFEMQSNTVGDYTCTVDNNVKVPDTDQATITVCLFGNPPDPQLDQTLCLNVDVPDAFVSLVCTPENLEDPNDPFMYQWLLGTTDLMVDSTQSVYPATLVGNYTCTVRNSIGPATTMFQVVAFPLAEITIAVTDAQGASRNRLVGTIPVGSDQADLYHLQFGDTVMLTCDNIRGDESVVLTIPNMVINSNTFTSTAITVESFANGTYDCTLTNPSFDECPSSNDKVVLRLVGEPPDIPPPNGNNVNIVGGNYCLPINGEIVLVCTVQSGTPIVLYEWRIDGSSTVFSTEETYRVTQAGSYECVATNHFGQDRATSIVVDPPQAVLTFTVTGVTGRTLTDSCSRLIEPLPPDSNVMHCPYVGDDIEVCCTSDIATSTITLEHNGQTASDGKFNFMDAKTTDRALIAGEYICRAELEAGCGTQVTGFAQLYDPAVVDRVIPIPPSTLTTNNVGVGRQFTPVPIPPGNEVVIFCPYSGLDDPTGRTFFFAIDSEGNQVPVDQLPSPKYTVEQRNDTIVLIISEYLPDEDLYHTFECTTMNQAGRDTQVITLQEDFVAWCTGEYGQCSRECHLGVRTRAVFCCQRDTRTPVDESRCDELPRPAAQQRCLEFGPCQLDPMWLPQPWSACSATCGGGYRIRELDCVIPGMNNMPAPAGSCDDLPLPIIFEYCNLESCCQADLNHSFCKLIATSPLCNQAAFQEVCCWTCKTYFYS